MIWFEWFNCTTSQICSLTLPLVSASEVCHFGNPSLPRPWQKLQFQFCGNGTPEWYHSWASVGLNMFDPRVQDKRSTELEFQRISVWSTFLQFCFERGSLTCYLLLRIPLPIPCYLFARKGLSEFKSVMRGQPVILLLNHHSTNKKDIQAISIPGLGSSLPSSHHCNPQVVMSGIRRPWVRPMCCEPTWFH